jgi:hypothetical protein
MEEKHFILGYQRRGEVSIVLPEPGSTECFTGRRQVSWGERWDVDTWNEEIDLMIAELEALRAEGRALIERKPAPEPKRQKRKPEPEPKRQI